MFAVALMFSSVYTGDESFWDWTNLVIDGEEKVIQKVSLIFSPDIYNAVYLPLKDLQYLASHPSFDKNKKTVMYIHGWLESGKMDLSVLAIRGAYLDRGEHNIISVDWSHYARNVNYHSRVIPQLKVIAESYALQLREFIESGYPIENIHLVGHSLGGQVVGKIGRQLRKITNDKMVIQKITALDPAGPGFEDRSIDGFEPITRTDGQYVQIIHTCGGQLGMQHRVGHIDFYPDGGSRHPGCDGDATTSLVGSFQYVCDHARSWHFYQASVRDPERFPAVRCASWDDFVENKTCAYDDIAYMGFGVDTKKTGKYYLQTNGNLFNLSRRMDGIRFMRVNLTRLMVPGDDYSPDVPPEVQERVLF